MSGAMRFSFLSTIPSSMRLFVSGRHTSRTSWKSQYQQKLGATKILLGDKSMCWYTFAAVAKLLRRLGRGVILEAILGSINVGHHARWGSIKSLGMRLILSVNRQIRIRREFPLALAASPRLLFKLPRLEKVL